MKLSILIPSYNMASKIEQCLASILCSKQQKAEVSSYLLDKGFYVYGL